MFVLIFNKNLSPLVAYDKNSTQTKIFTLLNSFKTKTLIGFFFFKSNLQTSSPYLEILMETCFSILWKLLKDFFFPRKYWAALLISMTFLFISESQTILNGAQWQLSRKATCLYNHLCVLTVQLKVQLTPRLIQNHHKFFKIILLCCVFEELQRGILFLKVLKTNNLFSDLQGSVSRGYH